MCRPRQVCAFLDASTDPGAEPLEVSSTFPPGGRVFLEAGGDSQRQNLWIERIALKHVYYPT